MGLCDPGQAGAKDLKHFVNKDYVAPGTFTGSDCILCRDFCWVVYRKGIE